MARQSASSPPPRVSAQAHRDAILDAAEAVVRRKGIGSLTLDAVAQEAGLSKAGLIHHVPTKDALITAMVDRHISKWQGEFRSLHGRHEAEGNPCPTFATMLDCCLAGTDSWNESERARNRVLVAALTHDEKHVEPLREVHREMEALMRKDRLPPGVGEIIHLAVHGLWFEWIFGLGEVTETRLAQVRSTLSRIADDDGMRPRESGSGVNRNGTKQKGSSSKSAGRKAAGSKAASSGPRSSGRIGS